MSESEEAGFLDAIASKPADDADRLIYADWLEDNGDPNRAELIRLQCNLERGLDWNTLQPPDAAHLEALRNREQELIEKMLAPCKAGERPGIRELTPEIARIVADEPQRISFCRGMVENLALTDTRITALPTGLHVGGDLDLWHTPITALPTGLHVGGSLYFDTAQRILTLPTGLHVGGNLNLSHTRITTLPPDLHVGGNLNLSHTHITTLPPDLHVGGDLNLWGTSISSDTAQRILTLPPDLHVGGNLNLSHTRITTLPPDLHVGGDLNLWGTSISSDTAQRILTMPNLSKQAKIRGLETALFPALADQARRLPETNTGRDTPPRP